MPVSNLLQDVVGIYGFPPPLSSVILMRYGLQPVPLQVGCLLTDHPKVSDGDTILVIRVGETSQNQQSRIGLSPMNPGGIARGITHDHGSIPQLTHSSKLLGNFKLPQFNGTSRQWKAWNKSLIRYLSIHQLDYVIEEGFLDLLPYSKDAFAANKLVYYILL